MFAVNSVRKAVIKHAVVTMHSWQLLVWGLFQFLCSRGRETEEDWLGLPQGQQGGAGETAVCWWICCNHSQRKSAFEVHMCTCVCAQTSLPHAHTCMHAHTHTHCHKCTHACTHTHIRTRTHTYTYTHTKHTHTHTHHTHTHHTTHIHYTHKHAHTLTHTLTL